MALLVMVVPDPAWAQEGCEDPAGVTYDDYDCRVERLRTREFVVVAVVDTGINPYHRDFRLAPGDDAHGVPPWEYIDGFPRDAEALSLSLDEADYDTALATDLETWKAVRGGRLYFVPGTTIIGAQSSSAGSGFGRIVDLNGHGTATASVAAGALHGSAGQPDVLVVALEGLGRDSLQWAASQPWIDVVTNSWAYTANLPLDADVAGISKAAVDAGKVVVFAAGNGITNSAAACDRALTTTSPAAGPSWVISVGAVSPVSGQDYCWHSVPPDVSSYGLHWPASAHDSTDGEIEFGGTSNATPIVAGVIAAQILQARQMLNDPREGPRADATLAAAAQGVALPTDGPLQDGLLTNTEVRDATLRTAYPVDFDAGTWLAEVQQEPSASVLGVPTTPAYFVYQGYGIVNADSRGRALDLLLGHEQAPDRSDVDTWMSLKHTVADMIWEMA